MESRNLGDRVAQPAGDQTPSDFEQHLEKAQRTHHLLGQYSRALDQIRLHLEHHGVGRVELPVIGRYN
jgi:hypothetical protein